MNPFSVTMGPVGILLLLTLVLRNSSVHLLFELLSLSVRNGERLQFKYRNEMNVLFLIEDFSGRSQHRLQ